MNPVSGTAWNSLATRGLVGEGCVGGDEFNVASVMAVFMTRFHTFKFQLIFLIIPLLLLFSYFLFLQSLNFTPVAHETLVYWTTLKLLVIIEEAHVKIQLISPCTGSLVFSLRDAPRVLIAFVSLIFCQGYSLVLTGH